jgi:hypothetical protein
MRPLQIKVCYRGQNDAVLVMLGSANPGAAWPTAHGHGTQPSGRCAFTASACTMHGAGTQSARAVASVAWPTMSPRWLDLVKVFTESFTEPWHTSMAWP